MSVLSKELVVIDLRRLVRGYLEPPDYGICGLQVACHGLENSCLIQVVAFNRIMGCGVPRPLCRHETDGRWFSTAFMLHGFEPAGLSRGDIVLLLLEPEVCWQCGLLRGL